MYYDGMDNSGDDEMEKLNPVTDYNEHSDLNLKGAVKVVSNYRKRMEAFHKYLDGKTTVDNIEAIHIHRTFKNMAEELQRISSIFNTNNLDDTQKQSVETNCIKMLDFKIPEQLFMTDLDVMISLKSLQYQCMNIIHILYPNNLDKINGYMDVIGTYFSLEIKRLAYMISEQDVDVESVESNDKILKLLVQKMYEWDYFEQATPVNKQEISEVCKNFVEGFSDMMDVVQHEEMRVSVSSIMILCNQILEKLGEQIHDKNILTCRFCGKPKLLL